MFMKGFIHYYPLNKLKRHMKKDLSNNRAVKCAEPKYLQRKKKKLRLLRYHDLAEA